MSVYVIVDDSDSNIAYSPIAALGNGATTSPGAEVNGWFVGGVGAYIAQSPVGTMTERRPLHKGLRMNFSSTRLALARQPRRCPTSSRVCGTTLHSSYP